MRCMLLAYGLLLGFGLPAQTPAQGTLQFRPAPLAPPGTNQTVAIDNDAVIIARSEVEYVLLDVSVKDSHGGYVGGLNKENFKIMDGTHAAEITAFYGRDVPVTVGLVVDNSGSMRNRREQTVLSALALVQASNPQDEVFVVNFNDTVVFPLGNEKPFTDDIPTLRSALLMNPVEGRTALYDALGRAMDHMNNGVREKKTLVLISDGKDNMSKTTREEILQRVQSSPVTIYTVGIYDADQRDKDPKFLKQLATLTGGTAHFPSSHDDLLAACRNIATEIRNRYTLGFVPGPEIPDGKPQKLAVTASGENGVKLKVHARPSYMRMATNPQAKAK